MLTKKPITILMADDDQDDQLLMEEALLEGFPVSRLYFVSDGEELLEYLYGQGQYEDPVKAPRPDLILLDLNMPKKDGREALKEIKTHPKLRHIPVVIFTTSYSAADVTRTYELGANSFVTKPVTFEQLVDVIQTMSKYWFEIVHLPV